MSRARRVRASGVLLLLALAAACSTGAAPAAPRTPAPVRDAWPGCEAVGAFSDDRGQGPSGVGGIPSGFAANTVVLCERGQRTNAAGDTVTVELERTSTRPEALLSYLGQPDEPPTDDACPAIAVLPPWLFLLDAQGRYLAPAIPRDACGLPLGWQTDTSAWEALPYSDRVLREVGVEESALARRTGCPMAFKDVVDAYAGSSHRRSGGFGRDPFGGQALRSCVYEVPAADRGTDAPSGDLVAGRALPADERAAVVAALAASPEVRARCRTANARFDVLGPPDGGPNVFVELDGCRRAVSDGGSTPVVRAGDALLERLSG